jgi:hypothetical protein
MFGGAGQRPDQQIARNGITSLGHPYPGHRWHAAGLSVPSVKVRGGGCCHQVRSGLRITPDRPLLLRLEPLRRGGAEMPCLPCAAKLSVLVVGVGLSCVRDLCAPWQARTTRGRVGWQRGLFGSRGREWWSSGRPRRGWGLNRSSPDGEPEEKWPAGISELLSFVRRATLHVRQRPSKRKPEAS